MHEDHPAEVFDISPLACPRCYAQVGEEDAYCSGCGLDLLESLSRLCGVCGRALSTTAAFCPGCGTQVLAQQGPASVDTPAVVTSTEVAAPVPEVDIAPPRSWTRRLWLKVSFAVLVAAIAALAGWWQFVRTDFSGFDS